MQWYIEKKENRIRQEIRLGLVGIFDKDSVFMCNKELKESHKERKRLERELQRKDKALAEAAALLVLRKKANAIWGDPEEE